MPVGNSVVHMNVPRYLPCYYRHDRVDVAVCYFAIMPFPLDPEPEQYARVQLACHSYG